MQSSVLLNIKKTSATRGETNFPRDSVVDAYLNGMWHGTEQIFKTCFNCFEINHIAVNETFHCQYAGKVSLLTNLTALLACLYAVLTAAQTYSPADRDANKKSTYPPSPTDLSSMYRTVEPFVERLFPSKKNRSTNTIPPTQNDRGFNFSRTSHIQRVP